MIQLEKSANTRCFNDAVSAISLTPIIFTDLLPDMIWVIRRVYSLLLTHFESA